MSFDDFSYEHINEAVLDLKQKAAIKPEIEEDDYGDLSEIDAEHKVKYDEKRAFRDDSSSADGDGDKQSENEEERRKLFKADDILDIEEAQEQDAFVDIQNQLEDNYLEIEEAI